MSMSKIQAELKAPKGQFNSFGKYKYRSCEDIVEAVKPILAKHEYYLSMSDDVVGVLGSRRPYNVCGKHDCQCICPAHRCSNSALLWACAVEAMGRQCVD